MGYQFYEVSDFSVLTDKKFRDLVGSIVWFVGRLRNTAHYYLDARFKIETVGQGDFQGFRYRVAANDGFLFFPPVRIDRARWFPRLQSATANFVGLQSINDQLVLDALAREYAIARQLQTHPPIQPECP